MGIDDDDNDDDNDDDVELKYMFFKNICPIFIRIIEIICGVTRVKIVVVLVGDKCLAKMKWPTAGTFLTHF
jgi:hypothetical protein